MPWWLAGMPPKTDKSKRQVCRSALHLHFAAYRWSLDNTYKNHILPMYTWIWKRAFKTSGRSWQRLHKTGSTVFGTLPPKLQEGDIALGDNRHALVMQILGDMALVEWTELRVSNLITLGKCAINSAAIHPLITLFRYQAFGFSFSFSS